jgi:hypothetical protein
MKKFLMIILAALPLAANAQDAGQMVDEGLKNNNIEQSDVNNWMGQAQQAQQCLAKIDQTAVQNLQAEGQGIADEIQKLCAAGDRAAAQAKAVAYGKKLAQDPNVLILKECAGFVNIDIPQTTWADLESDATTNHVCDIDM